MNSEQLKAYIKFSSSCNKHRVELLSKVEIHLDKATSQKALKEYKIIVVTELEKIQAEHDELLTSIEFSDTALSQVMARYNEIEQSDRSLIERLDAMLNLKAKVKDEIQSPESKGESLASDFKSVSVSAAPVAQLPVLEPIKFSGNMSEYFHWKRSFDTVIVKNVSDNESKLFYLTHYLTGEPRELVKGFLTGNSPDAFNQAIRKLDERYGDTYAFGENLLRDLEKFPKIQSNNPSALRHFSDRLQIVKGHVSSIPSLQFLNSPTENRRLVDKLPSYLVNTWRRKVVEHQRNHGEYPSFLVFASFIETEAEISNQVNLVGAGPKHNDSSSSSSGKDKPFNQKAFAHQTATSSDNQNVSANKFCFACKGKTHYISDCVKFAKMAVAEKDKIVSTYRLCRGCLRKNHVYKNCMRPMICELCHKKHPTSLHDSRELYRRSLGSAIPAESDDKAQNQFTGVKALTTHANSSHPSHPSYQFAPIIPVYVHSKDNPNLKLLVYCCIDTQSNTSFVSREILHALKHKGVPTTLSLSTMSHQSEKVRCERVGGLVITSLDKHTEIKLPYTYTRDSIPVDSNHIPTYDRVKQFPHLRFLEDKLLNTSSDIPVGLLIGYDVPRAQIPYDVVLPKQIGIYSPFAVKYCLGWSVIGSSGGSSTSTFMSHTSHKILSYPVNSSHTACDHVTEIGVPEKVTQVYVEPTPRDCLQLLEKDFIENDSSGSSSDISLSVLDRDFLKILHDGQQKSESGHYVYPLAFNSKVSQLKMNYPSAMKRLTSLKHRLLKNPALLAKYQDSMVEMESKGYSVPVNDLSKVKWILPHQPVIGKDKVRVVYDASSCFQGLSLNDCLLPGPDLNNSLLKVLTLFRVLPFAFVCDVQKMFYNFRVPESDSYFLCYLWWKDGDLSSAPAIYRMVVHSFGLRSAPSTCIYGLRQIAQDYESSHGPSVKEFLCNCVYVDDGLSSFSSLDEAIKVAKGAIEVCGQANLKLHKFASNDHRLLEALPTETSSNMQVSDVPISGKDLPTEKTLGIKWNVPLDCFQFTFDVCKLQLPHTKRGILSALSSIFDPCGFLAPFILVAKLIMQKTCIIGGRDWDEPVNAVIDSEWCEWLESFKMIERFKVSRCLTVSGQLSGDKLEGLEVVQLHIFNDASSLAFGSACYLVTHYRELPSVSRLIMSKSRVAPSKPLSIPRLELQAAVLGVKLNLLVRSILSQHNMFGNLKVQSFYYTDSKVVLGYISNMSRRFHTFVANRVGFIQSHSTIDQWSHVPSKVNVSDLVSRPQLLHQLWPSWEFWLNGPEFLRSRAHPDFSVPSASELEEAVAHTAEIKVNKNCFVSSTSVHVPLMDYKRFSSWTTLLNVVAIMLLFVNNLRLRVKSALSVQVRERARLTLLHIVQEEMFKEEFSCLKVGKCVIKSSPLYKLDCFIDGEGLTSVIRVGGRLRLSSYPSEEKHPIVLTYTHPISSLLVKFAHEKVMHQGRCFTSGKLRELGFWLIGGKRLVSSYIYKCVLCRRLRAAPVIPKMADLPPDRVQDCEAPFTFVGVDIFGHYIIKQRRSEVKRWACLFTCLSSRAVHIETIESLSTSSFIEALRRFISVRGPFQLLRSDQGTNLVGAERELKLEFNKVLSAEVKDFLVNNGSDFEWHFNPPHASHFGGVWERMIRTARSVMSALLAQHGSKLSDESFRTLMAETAAIINCRPLTLDSDSDPADPQMLSPVHLLTWKSRIMIPPPGEFQNADLYSVKCWRKTQFLLQEFWNKFRQQYLNILQCRQKWLKSIKNLSVGDVVMDVVPDAPRNSWPLARVTRVFPSADGIVRSVEIKTQNSTYHRPVSKIVLLMHAE